MRHSVFLEFNVTTGPLSRALSRDPIRMKDSYVDVPQNPGLGVEVDEKAIEKYRAQ
jgi:L-alanine-DL-glutamate epimerase-like enolase superfamily enzyme